jgi:hypothetical protein
MKKFEEEKKKDPLEELFRGRENDLDIEYRDDDWRALQPGLDLIDAKAAHRVRIRYISAAAVILIVLFSYFTFHNYSRINELSDQIAQSEQRTLPNGEIEQRSDPALQDLPGDDEPEPPGASLTESDLNTLADLTDNPDEDSEMQAITHGTNEGTENLSTETVNRLIDRSNTILNRKPVTAARLINMNSGQPKLHDKYFNTMESAVTEDFTAMIAQPVENSSLNTRPSESSRITVGLALSPDATGAGSISGFRDPGYKAGAVIEYAFSDKLSASVGIIQTEVRYRAASGQYNPPYYWPPGSSPDEIIATCLMFDIPVSIKYNFVTFERSRLYSTVSLTSYIMRNEDYRFRYSEGASGYPESWSAHTGKGYWLSNAGFSIGYEYDLNRTWSLRAEPFIRVPIREVGWGNAKLYSVGSFISLNYRL